jgi:hypothetical protein
VLKDLQRDLEEASAHVASMQRDLIQEAVVIRQDLAEAAPEVDNSDMVRPNDQMDRDYTRYDLASFARFDELVNVPVDVRYAPLPNGASEDDPVGTLLIILRGRLLAAQHGEDTPNGLLIRDDLGDFGRRIGNLSRKHEHVVREHRQNERTLPMLGYARAVAFGSELNPEPRIIETDEDKGQWINQLFMEYGDPRARVREFVNGAQMDEPVRRRVQQIEATLKLELERFHQELIRRLSKVPFWRSPLKVALTFVGTIASGVIVAVIVAYLT